MGQVNPNIPLGLSSGIIEYPNAIDESICRELISYLSQDFKDVFAPGPTLGGIMESMKRSMDTSFMNPDQYTPDRMPHLGVYQKINAIIHDTIWSCISDYIQHYRHLWTIPSCSITGARIQRYYKNYGYYREHCDGMPWDSDFDGNGNIRILAVVAYLNTVSDGGGTNFPLHNYTASAEVGKIVVFPTTWQYPHLGTVPYSEDKWIISSFVNTTKLQIPQNEPVAENVFIEPTVKKNAKSTK